MANDRPDWQSHEGSLLLTVLNTDATSHVQTLPLGALAVGYAARTPIVGGTMQVKITGTQTGIPYISDLSPNQIQALPQAAILDQADSQVTVQVLNGSLSGSVDFMAWTAPMAVQVKQRAGDVLTVQEGTAPPLWQAPTQIGQTSLSATGTSNLLAPVANKTTRVFGWWLQVDGQTAGATTAFLEDTLLGTFIAGIVVSGANGISPADVSGTHHGAPLSVGAGLQLHVVAIGTGAIVRAAAGVNNG